MTKSRTSKVHKTPRLSVINPNNIVAKTPPVNVKTVHNKSFDRDSIALPSIGNDLNRKGSFVNSYSNSNSHFTPFGKCNSTSTISFSSSGSSIFKNSQTRLNNSQNNQPMRLFKKCKARIDHTLKIYEQMNKQANVDAGSKNIDSSEEVFLNTILSKLDKCRDHVLRIDVAMLVDRYRRMMSRTGISKLNENVQEDKIDGLLSEMEEWCLKASLDDGLDIEDVSELSDTVFQDMIHVDKELMVEGDLQKLKDKMAKLQRLNGKLGGTTPEHLKQDLILEKQKLEKEVAEKISENNKAKNDNVVIMHAADEIFHLIEKARTQSGANDDTEYQNQIAAVLKELVKRDEVAADQSKKLKIIQEECERTKQDFFQLMDDHKDLKSEFDKVSLKCEKINGENINLKKKLSSSGKNKAVDGTGPKISEEYALQKIKSLEEKNKHFEEQNKILTQKNKLLSDTIHDKDGELNNYCEQVSHLKRTTNFNNNAVAEQSVKKQQKEKSTSKKKDDNESKRKNKSKKDDKNQTDDKSILLLQEEIKQYQEQLSSANSREQLLCRSNDKNKQECKEMSEKLTALNKSLDFKSRELENIQAELNILRKQGKREATSNNKQVTKTEIKTSNFSAQTEVILKTLSLQIDIPLEKITLEGNYNITTLIKILHHKAGITDLSKVLKLFKKSNEREITNIQQQVSGYIPGTLNEHIPDFDLNKLDGNTIVVNQQNDEFKMKTIDDIRDFGMFLGHSLEGNGNIMNDLLLDLKQNCTLSKPNENKMSQLEEQISEFIEGTGDLLNYSKRNNNQLGGNYRVKAKVNEPEGNVEDSLTVSGFIRKSTNLNNIMSNTIHNFKDIACDELRKMAVERENLKKRLAAKYNNNDGGGGEEPIRHSGDDHNPEDVLDDIQSMLENRLAKRRASTLNFSSLINKNTNIVHLRKPGRGRKGNKHDMSMSIKSDPGQKTTVTRRPSVMAIMKKMTIQNAEKSDNNDFAIMNSNSRVQNTTTQGLNGNALNTPNRQSMFGTLPKTAPGIPTNLTKFEKEYQKTQLRMHRREKIAGSNIQGLSATSASNRPLTRPSNFTVGFGKSAGYSNGGTNFGMVVGRGGRQNSSHFEGLLTNTTSARNRLNPVFGSNLPRHNRRY